MTNIKQDSPEKLISSEDLDSTLRSAFIRSKVVERNTKRAAYLIASFNRLYPLIYRKNRDYRLTNVYHCCTQKTASQWFRAIFHDPAFYKATGLVSCPYIEMGLRNASFKKAFPRKTVATHLYAGYQAYATIPKPKDYKTFFVLRDPRDTVVSWYFSAKNSHVLIEPIPEMRLALQSMNMRDGLIYIIDRLQDFGSFDAQKSWVDCPTEEDRIRLFRYESLADDDDVKFLKSIFQHLEVELPEPELIDLAKRHTFSRLSKGREQGEEDINSHYRKGKSGDWKNYFDAKVMNHFLDVTGDLTEQLGYEL